MNELLIEAYKEANRHIERLFAQGCKMPHATDFHDALTEAWCRADEILTAIKNKADEPKTKINPTAKTLNVTYFMAYEPRQADAMIKWLKTHGAPSATDDIEITGKPGMIMFENEKYETLHCEPGDIVEQLEDKKGRFRVINPDKRADAE
jgi:hypothetical protein